MRRLIVTFVFLMGIVAAPAHAQGVARIVGNTGLSPEDLAIMGENARQLYDVANPQVGRSIDWSNPTSKSHGTTTLAGMSNGCASIQQVTHPKGQTQPLTIRTRFCRDANGNWVLQP